MGIDAIERDEIARIGEAEDLPAAVRQSPV
jgi:hypothetical protein